MDKKLAISRSCAALRAVMQYRKVTMAEVAKGTGLSYRSIEGYYYGRNDMAHGKVYNIVEIEHFLDIDGRILTGSKSIDTFYEAEDRKLKEPDLHHTCVCEAMTTYALTKGRPCAHDGVLQGTHGRTRSRRG